MGPGTRAEGRGKVIPAFISSFYFYVNIENVHTRITPWTLVFLLLKICEKLKQILIMPPSVIRICFNRKGFPWDQTNLNWFIYIENIAVTLCICYKIVVIIVIVIKCAINFQCDSSIRKIMNKRNCWNVYRFSC